LIAPIKVLIVDGQTLVVEALRLVLENDAGFEVVGVAGTAAEAGEVARATRPGVLVMEDDLSDRTIAQTAADIRRELPDVAILLLTTDRTSEAVAAAVEAGAAGYLTNSQAPGSIAEAVRRAADGEMVVPAHVLAALIVSQRADPPSKDERARLVDQFTPQERRILELMGQGFDNASIAAVLRIGLTPVQEDVRNILGMLDARSKLEAVAKAAGLRLLRL
jgi:DNA-binding NarL/FixJ family response regulator